MTCSVELQRNTYSACNKTKADPVAEITVYLVSGICIVCHNVQVLGLLFQADAFNRIFNEGYIVEKSLAQNKHFLIKDLAIFIISNIEILKTAFSKILLSYSLKQA